MGGRLAAAASGGDLLRAPCVRRAVPVSAGVGERSPRGERLAGVVESRDETNPEAYTIAVVFGRRGERRRSPREERLAGVVESRDEANPEAYTIAVVLAAAASGGDLLRAPWFGGRSLSRRGGVGEGRPRGERRAAGAGVVESRDEMNPEAYTDRGRFRPPRRAAGVA